MEGMAFHKFVAGGSSCRELKNLSGGGVPTTHVPWANVGVERNDAVVPVQEDGINGKAHEEHVNGVAGSQKDALAFRQVVTAKQTLQSKPEFGGVCDRADFPAFALHDKPFHGKQGIAGIDARGNRLAGKRWLG